MLWVCQTSGIEAASLIFFPAVSVEGRAVNVSVNSPSTVEPVRLDPFGRDESRQKLPFEVLGLEGAVVQGASLELTGIPCGRVEEIEDWPRADPAFWCIEPPPVPLENIKADAALTLESGLVEEVIVNDALVGDEIRSDLLRTGIQRAGLGMDAVVSDAIQMGSGMAWLGVWEGFLTVLVGAEGGESSPGSIYVLRKESDGSWAGGEVEEGSSDAGSGFGCSIAFLHDLDRDGWAREVAVGAKTGGEGREGLVHVLWLERNDEVDGSHMRVAQMSVVRPTDVDSNLVDTEGLEFGAAVAFLGDANIDGWDNEIAVGAPGGNQAGRVFVVSLGEGGNVLESLEVEGTVVQSLVGDRFGASLAAMAWPGTGLEYQGDEGHSNLIVGAPGYRRHGSVQGAFYVLVFDPAFTGATSAHAIGKPGTPLASFGDGEDVMFATSLTSIGDANGDGVTSELLVVSQGESTAEQIVGAIYYIQLVESDGTIDFVFQLNPPPNTLLPLQTIQRVFYLGDCSQDGIDDIAIQVAGDGFVDAWIVPLNDIASFPAESMVRFAPNIASTISQATLYPPLSQIPRYNHPLLSHLPPPSPSYLAATILMSPNAGFPPENASIILQLYGWNCNSSRMLHPSEWPAVAPSLERNRYRRAFLCQGVPGNAMRRPPIGDPYRIIVHSAKEVPEFASFLANARIKVPAAMKRKVFDGYVREPQAIESGAEVVWVSDLGDDGGEDFVVPEHKAKQLRVVCWNATHHVKTTITPAAEFDVDPSRSFPISAAYLGDLDGDGFAREIVLAGDDEGLVLVFLGASGDVVRFINYASHFEPYQNILVGLGAALATIGDVDQDGRMYEVAMTAPQTQGGGALVYIQFDDALNITISYHTRVSVPHFSTYFPETASIGESLLGGIDLDHDLVFNELLVVFVNEVVPPTSSVVHVVFDASGDIARASILDTTANTFPAGWLNSAVEFAGSMALLDTIGHTFVASPKRRQSILAFSMFASAAFESPSIVVMEVSVTMEASVDMQTIGVHDFVQLQPGALGLPSDVLVDGSSLTLYFAGDVDHDGISDWAIVDPQGEMKTVRGVQLDYLDFPNVNPLGRNNSATSASDLIPIPKPAWMYPHLYTVVDQLKRIEPFPVQPAVRVTQHIQGGPLATWSDIFIACESIFAPQDDESVLVMCNDVPYTQGPAVKVAMISFLNDATTAVAYSPVTRILSAYEEFIHAEIGNLTNLPLAGSELEGAVLAGGPASMSTAKSTLAIGAPAAEAVIFTKVSIIPSTPTMARQVRAVDPYLFETPSAGNAFGTAVAWLSDLNGDGEYNECAIGAPLSDSVYIVFLNSTSLVVTSYKVIPGRSAGATRFGMSLVAVQDPQKNHRSMGLAVGRPWANDGAGGVAVVELNAAGDEVARQYLEPNDFPPETDFVQVGQSLACVPFDEAGNGRGSWALIVGAANQQVWRVEYVLNDAVLQTTKSEVIRPGTHPLRGRNIEQSKEFGSSIAVVDFGIYTSMIVAGMEDGQVMLGNVGYVSPFAGTWGMWGLDSIPWSGNQSVRVAGAGDVAGDMFSDMWTSVGSTITLWSLETIGLHTLATGKPVNTIIRTSPIPPTTPTPTFPLAYPFTPIFPNSILPKSANESAASFYVAVGFPNVGVAEVVIDGWHCESSRFLSDEWIGWNRSHDNVAVFCDGIEIVQDADARVNGEIEAYLPAKNKDITMTVTRMGDAKSMRHDVIERLGELQGEPFPAISAAAFCWGDVDGDGRVFEMVLGLASDGEHGSVKLVQLSSENPFVLSRVIDTIGHLPVASLESSVRFGTSVAYIGRLRQDGPPNQALVGAPFDVDDQDTVIGGAYIVSFESQPGVSKTKVALTFPGRSASNWHDSKFGAAVAYLGDVDGNGFAGDVMIAAPKYEPENSDGEDLGAVVHLGLDGSGRVVRSVVYEGKSYGIERLFGMSLAVLSGAPQHVTIAVGISGPGGIALFELEREADNLNHVTTYHRDSAAFSPGPPILESTSIGTAMGVVGVDFDGDGRTAEVLVTDSVGEVHWLSLAENLHNPPYRIAVQSWMISPGIGGLGADKAISTDFVAPIGDVFGDGTTGILIANATNHPLLLKLKLLPGGIGEKALVWGLSDVAPNISAAIAIGPPSFLHTMPHHPGTERILSASGVDPERHAFVAILRLPQHLLARPSSLATTQITNVMIASHSCQSTGFLDGWGGAKHLDTDTPTRLDSYPPTAYYRSPLLAVTCEGPPGGAPGTVAELQVGLRVGDTSLEISSQQAFRFSDVPFGRLVLGANTETVIPNDISVSSSGTSIAFLGDVNGDGIANDVVVGAPGVGEEGGEGDQGALFLAFPHPGPVESYFVGFGHRGIPTMSNGARLGQSVCALYDLDGDGLPREFAIGAPGSLSNDLGRVFVATVDASGKSIGNFVDINRLDGLAPLSTNGDRLGTSLVLLSGSYTSISSGSAAVLAVGAPGVAGGRVILVALSVEGTVHGTPRAIPFARPSDGNSFGFALSTIHKSVASNFATTQDVFLVGDPHFGDSDSNVGRVYVMNMFGTGIASVTVFGSELFTDHHLLQPGDLFGSAVASVDLDGDGVVGEALIGAPGSNSVWVAWPQSGEAGTIVRFLRLADRLGGIRTAVFRAWGSSIAVGDMNGDGAPDYIIGDPGRQSNAGNVDFFYGYNTRAPPSSLSIISIGVGTAVNASVVFSKRLSGFRTSIPALGSPTFRVRILVRIPTLSYPTKNPNPVITIDNRPCIESRWEEKAESTLEGADEEDEKWLSPFEAVMVCIGTPPGLSKRRFDVEIRGSEESEESVVLEDAGEFDDAERLTFLETFHLMPGAHWEQHVTSIATGGNVRDDGTIDDVLVGLGAAGRVMLLVMEENGDVEFNRTWTSDMSVFAVDDASQPYTGFGFSVAWTPDSRRGVIGCAAVNAAVGVIFIVDIGVDGTPLATQLIRGSTLPTVSDVTPVVGRRFATLLSTLPNTTPWKLPGQSSPDALVLAATCEGIEREVVVPPEETAIVLFAIAANGTLESAVPIRFSNVDSSSSMPTTTQFARGIAWLGSGATNSIDDEDAGRFLAMATNSIGIHVSSLASDGSTSPSTSLSIVPGKHPLIPAGFGGIGIGTGLTGVGDANGDGWSLDLVVSGNGFDDLYLLLLTPTIPATLIRMIPLQVPQEMQQQYMYSTLAWAGRGGLGPAGIPRLFTQVVETGGLYRIGAFSVRRPEDIVVRTGLGVSIWGGEDTQCTSATAGSAPCGPAIALQRGVQVSEDDDLAFLVRVEAHVDPMSPGDASSLVGAGLSIGNVPCLNVTTLAIGEGEWIQEQTRTTLALACRGLVLVDEVVQRATEGSSSLIVDSIVLRGVQVTLKERNGAESRVIPTTQSGQFDSNVNLVSLTASPVGGTGVNVTIPPPNIDGSRGLSPQMTFRSPALISQPNSSTLLFSIAPLTTVHVVLDLVDVLGRVSDGDTIGIALELFTSTSSELVVQNVSVQSETAEDGIHALGGVWGSVFEADVTLCMPYPTTPIPLTTVAITSLGSLLRTQQVQVNLAQPLVESITTSSAKLNPFGGDILLFHGENFGTSNASNAEAMAAHPCMPSWQQSGERTLIPPPDVPYADPTLLVFAAYVGNRRCIETTWISATTIKCRTPPGIGTQRIMVVIDGVRAKIADETLRVSYDSIPPPETVSPTGVPVSPGDVLYVSHPWLQVNGLKVPETSLAPSVLTLASDATFAIKPMLALIQGNIQPATSRANVSEYEMAAVFPSAQGRFRPQMCLTDLSLVEADGSSIYFFNKLYLGTDEYDLESAKEEGNSCSASSPTDEALIFTNPPTVAKVTPAADLDPEGGQVIELVVQGILFAPSALALKLLPLQVWIGRQLCLAVDYVRIGYITCSSPRGIPGTSVGVSVDIAGILSTPIDVGVVQVSILAVEPFKLLPARAGAFTETLRVTVLGAEEINGLYLDGIACPEEHFSVDEIAGELLCSAFPLPPFWNSDEVWVTVDGKGEQAFAKRPLLRTQPPPVILGLDFGGIGAAKPTKGGFVVNVLGDGFGTVPVDVARVLVGGEVVEDVNWIESKQISITVPAGIGDAVGVVVESSRELSSEPFYFSYSPPTISRVKPTSLLPGVPRVNITLCGTNFPSPTGLHPLSQENKIVIGGIPCETIVELNVSCARCEDFSTPRATPESLVLNWIIADGVEVEFGGQSSGIVQGFVDLVPPPTITAITPELAGPGDILQIEGSGLAVVERVYVEGVECDELSHPTPATLSCTIPSTHFLWTRPGATTDYVVPSVQIVVESSTALSSSPATIQPTGLRLRPPPSTQPRGVSAWRILGQGRTLEVRWRFPSRELEALVIDELGEEVVTEFEIEAAVTSNFTQAEDNVAISVGRDASFERADVNNWNRHSFKIPLSTVQPLRVRIRSSNDDGDGEWVEVGGFVYESCQSPQYLATQIAQSGKMEDVRCLDCPLGAVCGGLQSGNVTALREYWRVPWSRDELGFAICPIAGACLGHQGRVSVSSVATSSNQLPANASLTTRWAAEDADDYPTAIPGARLLPAEYESCREGHRGVMCSACEEGFYEGSGGVCLQCGDSTAIAIRFFLLLLLVLALLSALLLRAWRMRSSASSREVQVAKLALTHVQTISIIGSVQLQWPKIAMDFFAAIDVGSSFSTSGLAIECLWENRSPFTRTLVVLTMPVWLLLYAAMLWGFVALIESRFDCCDRILNAPPDPTPKPSTARARTIASKKRRSVLAITADEQRDWKMFESRIAALQRPRQGTLRPGAEKVGVEQNRRRSILLDKAQAKSPWAVYWRRMLVSSIVIGFLVHTPLSAAAFRLLTCRSVAPDDDPSSSQLRLAMDMDVSCEDSASLAAMLGIGVPMIVFIAFGIPFGLAALLAHIGPANLAKPEWRSLLSFAYVGYRLKTYYWESGILLRKVFLAAVTTTLAPSGPGLQVASALLVVLIAQIVHSRLSPFANVAINALESFGLIAAALSLVCAIAIVLDDAGAIGDAAAGQTSTTASVIIITINAIFITCCFALLSKRVREAVDTGYEIALFYYEQSMAQMERRQAQSGGTGVTTAPATTSDFAFDNPLVRSQSIREKAAALFSRPLAATSSPKPITSTIFSPPPPSSSSSSSSSASKTAEDSPDGLLSNPMFRHK